MSFHGNRIPASKTSLLQTVFCIGIGFFVAMKYSHVTACTQKNIAYKLREDLKLNEW